MDSHSGQNGTAIKHKRVNPDDHESSPSPKKQRQQSASRLQEPALSNHKYDRADASFGSKRSPKGSSRIYDEALKQLPPKQHNLGHVPAYTHFVVSPGLPPLPSVIEGPLSQAPFRHKSSAVKYDRIINDHDVTYERLEFLGDAQLEHIASRLIYERFSALAAGQQSQLRELLIKNETLAEYARLYGFDLRVKVGDMQRMQADSKDKGNKGFNKILGDVFEAYVAAVILSHGDDGFGIVEEWMTALWAPKLVEAAKQHRFKMPQQDLLAQTDVDPLNRYNPNAKADLQKLIVAPQDVRLVYQTWKPSIELKGAQLGQNLHFIALYLCGYGYTEKLLGKGEGKNKVEAGNWAATQAMHGTGKNIVDECAKKLTALREERKAAQSAKDKDKREV